MSKLIPVICAVAFLFDVSVHADDTAEQAAARAALLKAMNASAPPTNSTPRIQSHRAPAAPVRSDNKSTISTPQKQQTITAGPGDTAEQAAARAALLKAMNAGAPQVTPPQVRTSAPPVAVAPKKTKTKAQIAPQRNVPPSAGDTAEQAAARAALLKAMNAGAPPATSAARVENPAPTPSPTKAQIKAQREAQRKEMAAREKERAKALAEAQAKQEQELQAQRAAVLAQQKAELAAQEQARLKQEQELQAHREAVRAQNQRPGTMTIPPGVNTNPAATEAPIQAPPLPISATKQAELQALTAKYKANQISPADYFKQREAILAEP